MSRVYTQHRLATISTADGGIELKTYNSPLELVEAEAYAAWVEFPSTDDHVAWLRALADRVEAKHHADANAWDDPDSYGASG